MDKLERLDCVHTKFQFSWSSGTLSVWCRILYIGSKNAILRCVLASLYEVVSVGWSVRRMVRRMVGWSVTRFFMPKMSGFLHENHWDSPTLTLVNVFGVLGYLYVLICAYMCLYVLICAKQWVACQ